MDHVYIYVQKQNAVWSGKPKALSAMEVKQCGWLKKFGHQIAEKKDMKGKAVHTLTYINWLSFQKLRLISTDKKDYCLTT